MSVLVNDETYPARRCATSTLSSADSEIVLFCMAGELDRFTIPAMQRQLAECLAASPRHLVVDISELSFCSIWGLDLLVQTKRAAEQTATNYAVSGAPAQADRLWRRLWPASDLPTCHPTAAGAILVASRALRAVRQRTSQEVVRAVALTPVQLLSDLPPRSVRPPLAVAVLRRTTVR